MEPHRATSSGGAGAVKPCGSDNSCFELMFNIINTFRDGGTVFFSVVEPEPHHLGGAVAATRCGSGIKIFFFRIPNPDPDPDTPLNPDPIRIRIHNPEKI
jgi:hypothetical protein